MENKHSQNTYITLKSLLLGLIFLCATLPGNSQQLTIAPVPLPDLNLGPNQSILGMCQDNNGFIWMATNGSGLYKYDGNQLKNYTEEENNPNSIISNQT